MNGPEQRLVWKPFQKLLRERKWHFQRFEDKLTAGIPDVNVFVPGMGEIWIELKYIDVAEPRGNVAVGLLREQYIWLYSGSKAGRRCYLLARAKFGGWYVWDEPGGWALAKRTTPWESLAAVAMRKETLVEVVSYFAHYHQRNAFMRGIPERNRAGTESIISHRYR